MRKTALYDKHLQLKARTTDFAGWDMPLQYSSIKEECEAVRNNWGLFDVSHMGEFLVKGPEARKFVDYLLPNAIDEGSNNKAIYSPMCNKNGGVVDDLITYVLDENLVLICVNAANIEKDFNWMNDCLKESSHQCQLENISDAVSLIAVQGPRAIENIKEVLSSLGISWNAPSKFAFNTLTTQSNLLPGLEYDLLVARTGYTGEDGVEIFTTAELANQIWDQAVERKATPCGLAARDTLRIEAGYPLYGQELTDDLMPTESGLNWTVKLSKLESNREFVGGNQLAEKAPKQRLVKFQTEKLIPRLGYAMYLGDQKIGTVTSGTFSPALQKGIGMGLVTSDSYQQILSDAALQVEIRGTKVNTVRHKKSALLG